MSIASSPRNALEHDAGETSWPADVSYTHRLTSQVAQLLRLDESSLNSMATEAREVQTWQRSYMEFQNGDWWTTSLLNSTGRVADNIIADCKPQPTATLAKMPTTQAFIADLGFDIMWARLARLEPGGFLWEHRDYAELEPIPRVRLHVPLEVDPDAYLIISGQRIFMDTGFIWKLDPVNPHAVAHFGSNARIHLIVDCYVNYRLRELFLNQWLDQAYLHSLPSLSDRSALTICMEARWLIEHGQAQMAEATVLKLFHQFNLSPRTSFDYLSELYFALGDTEKGSYWKSKKSYYLGEAAP